MDFIVLFIMKELLKEHTTIQRISIASIIASFGGCIAIVLKMPTLVKFLFLYLGIHTLVLWIAFGFKDWRAYVIKVIAFFGIAFFVDGFLNFMYYRLDMEKYYRQLCSGTILEKVSILHLIACIGGIILLYPIFTAILHSVRENVLLLHHIKITNKGRQLEGIGLLDTGNMLFDPLSGEPVLIAEYEWMKGLFTVNQQKMLLSYMNMNQVSQEGPQQTEEEEETPIMIRMIPFHSVGKEEGMLVAVRLDSIVIGEESGLKRRENVLMGLYPGRLSAKRKYQVILHNEMIS